MRIGTPLLTALALLGSAAVIVTSTVYAQTNGMDRRDDRQGDRQGSRAAKQACKAGDEKSRAECRQTKRDVKHDNVAAPSPTPAATTPTPPK